MTVALIDADIICYQAAAAAEEEVDWGDGEPSSVLGIENAIDRAREMIEEWRKGSQCKRARLCFSDRSGDKATFRYTFYPEYKGQRKEKPKLHGEVYQWLKDNYAHSEVRGLEGDDVIGVLLTGDEGGKYVAVSTDKDMKTLAGKHFNPRTGESFKVSVPVANREWMYQTLTGDTVDNYKGCPFIGKKKADAILVDRLGLLKMWPRVVDTYEAQYEKHSAKYDNLSPFDLALRNARCARILRACDYVGGKIRLWHPDEEKVEWLTIT